MTDGPGSHPPDGGEPITEAPADGTLGGYLERHSRPPAFEGADGHPYTVSVEIEKDPDLSAPFSGYLVFPRWARTGVGIVGHLETPFLLHGPSRRGVEAAMGSLTLLEVQDLLNQAIRQHQEETDSC